MSKMSKSEHYNKFPNDPTYILSPIPKTAFPNFSKNRGKTISLDAQGWVPEPPPGGVGGRVWVR